MAGLALLGLLGYDAFQKDKREQQIRQVLSSANGDPNAIVQGMLQINPDLANNPQMLKMLVDQGTLASQNRSARAQQISQMFDSANLDMNTALQPSAMRDQYRLQNALPGVMTEDQSALARANVGQQFKSANDLAAFGYNTQEQEQRAQDQAGLEQLGFQNRLALEDVQNRNQIGQIGYRSRLELGNLQAKAGLEAAQNQLPKMPAGFEMVMGPRGPEAVPMKGTNDWQAGAAKILATDNQLKSVEDYYKMISELPPGGALYGEKAGRINKIRSKLITQLSLDSNTGTINEGEYQRFDKIIPNPTTFTGAASFKSTNQAMLDQLYQDALDKAQGLQQQYGHWNGLGRDLQKARNNWIINRARK
jgi:hypothetical protein